MTLPHTDAPVAIVGAGPVGLTLALDLAHRRIPSVVIEQREPEERATPRANHVSARAMETFRRLGLADEIRRAGLPAHHPADVTWVTSMTGYELARVVLSDRDGHAAEDADWPTPEPQHKINQMFLEPILRRAAEEHPLITLRMPARLAGFTQDEKGVVCRILDGRSPQETSLRTEYIVGCDGGGSTVRKLIGARFEGDAALTKVVSFHVRAPDLMERLPRPLAHRYFIVNNEQRGVVVTLDGEELWSFHAMLPSVDADPDDLDPDAAIRRMSGLADLEYEIFAIDSWTGRRLLANRLHDRRALLCGDAAHIWVPNAGYGMNAGIADAENAAWRLAARMEGWGGPGLLEGYERERHPITDQVSNTAKDLAVSNQDDTFRTPPPALSEPGEIGERERVRVGDALAALNRAQFLPLGLNFGYYYDDSPQIAYDGASAPPYAIGSYEPSTVPGCRAPYAEPDGTPLYDLLGSGFSLVRTDPEIDVSELTDAAKRRGVPLIVLDLSPSALDGLYERPLTLVRPDRHVAWRGASIEGFDWARLTGW